MKPLILGLFIALSFASCHKHHNCSTPISNPDYFEFGYSGGIAGIQKKFVIKGGSLYPTDTLHARLSPAQFVDAQRLITDLPNYLRLHPNQDFACPGCADEFVIHIKLTEGGVMQTWNIDTYPDALPVEIRAYTTEAYDVIERL